MKKEKDISNNVKNSEENLKNEENCKCEEHNCDCKHDENCECDCGCKDGKECNCKEGECECENCGCEDCKCEDCKQEEKAIDQYLALAQRIQAEFENYRRRMADQLVLERQEGVISVIDVFLPCLDTFKEAKKSITDEKVLEGVNMIENKILDALNRLKVEKIETIGQKFDPKIHDVVAVMHDENKDDDIILDEYQAGYKYNGKVIRYSKVIVNKREVK